MSQTKFAPCVGKKIFKQKHHPIFIHKTNIKQLSKVIIPYIKDSILEDNFGMSVSVETIHQETTVSSEKQK